MPTEKRRSPRISANRKVQVTYVDDQGLERFEIVNAQDFSPVGCRLILHFRCRPRTVISIALSPLLSGSASIRFQNPSPRGYITGLEFLGGFRLPEPSLP